jgi:hypothetical protein
MPIRRNPRKQLGGGTFDQFNDLNGEDYKGLEATDSNERCWNDYESITSKRVNNHKFKTSQMSPFNNGSSSSSSNKGGLINEGGYFSSGDMNFG